MKFPIIVLGGGGHARVLIDTLLELKLPLLGFTVPNPELSNALLGVPCIGTDDAVTNYLPSAVELVNGLGSVGVPNQRKRLFQQLKEKGYHFSSVIHPAAVIGREVELSEGIQIMAGAIVQTGSSIGNNTIVNTRASVDHDCVIGDHVHLAPGVTLSGGVKVGAEVHIGTGATVIQGVRIGANSIIGAGALVLKDVPEGATVFGVPAKEVQL
ncbi:acetyltransferase [Effusibacillus dendaii]|uniref:Pilus assembly protein n=1 Tax=Effusibacillus dendaii TaxID=2743772 RepID=A0A7I8DF10_9BACL|nr:acetyltransferase [Effusibacillus dendaii]BCJ87882.1 pilus assembly protein [Effusibacillus dendaii]